jgi:hypothetical protein
MITIAGNVQSRINSPSMRLNATREVPGPSFSSTLDINDSFQPTRLFRGLG